MPKIPWVEPLALPHIPPPHESAYWSPYMLPEKPPAGAHEALSEMYGRLMIQSVLPHWSDGARHAFRLAAEMVECRLLGEQFDEDGRGLPIALHTDGLPDEVRPGPWGPPELQLRENYDAIVARRRRGRA